MVGLGVFLVILGIGSLVLPMFDIQFQLMRIVDAYQPIAGIAIALLGGVLISLGLRRRPAQQPPVTQDPPTT